MVINVWKTRKDAVTATTTGGEPKKIKLKNESKCLHILYPRKAVQMYKSAKKERFIYCMISPHVSKMLVSGAPVVQSLPNAVPADKLLCVCVLLCTQ